MVLFYLVLYNIELMIKYTGREAMKKYILIFLSLVFLYGFSYPHTNKTLKGRVSDQEGKPLADVRVEVYKTSIVTRTLSDGTFILEGITPGKHEILFTHLDYMPGVLEIDVSKNAGKTVNFDLFARNSNLLNIRKEITVTAEADSIIDISLPSHRTILPGSILSELGTSNIAETVKNVPGVDMVGKGGYSMVPAIRGLAEHRILLLVDGVPITSERRIGASASFINLNDIDHIELNRGPYSVFYGSGAIGGIINMVTKSPLVNAPLAGKFQIGYNSVRKERAASFNLSGSSGKFGFVIGVNGKKADDYSSPSGIIEQSHYSDYDFNFKVLREWHNSQLYFTFLNYQGVNIGKPSPTSKLKPCWYPKERNTLFTLGYKIKNRFHLDTLNASFYLTLPMLETQKDNLRENLTVKKRNLARIEGTDFGFKVRGGKGLDKKHTLNFGLDFFGRRGVNDSNDEWEFDEYGNISGITEETSLLDACRDNFGLYIDDKIQISSLMSMDIGARFDWIKTSNIVELDKRISRSDRSFTAYIGSIFQLTPHFSLLANLGRSFRFPTISELFYSGLTGRGTVFGDVNLSPERSINMDIGLRYLHGKYYTSIYGFSNLVSDMIQKYSGVGEDEYYYRNLSQGRIMGIEGEFYLWLIKNFEFFINFHHIVGKEKGTFDALNYIPASRMYISSKYSIGKFWMESKLTMAAPKKDPGPLELAINGYTLWDTIFGCKLNKDIVLLAIVQNILNQTYRLSADEKGVDAMGRGVVLKMSYSF